MKLNFKLNFSLSPTSLNLYCNQIPDKQVHLSIGKTKLKLVIYINLIRYLKTQNITPIKTPTQREYNQTYISKIEKFPN